MGGGLADDCERVEEFDGRKDGFDSGQLVLVDCSGSKHFFLPCPAGRLAFDALFIRPQAWLKFARLCKLQEGGAGGDACAPELRMVEGLSAVEESLRQHHHLADVQLVGIFD